MTYHPRKGTKYPQNQYPKLEYMIWLNNYFRLYKCCYKVKCQCIVVSQHVQSFCANVRLDVNHCLYAVGYPFCGNVPINVPNVRWPIGDTSNTHTLCIHTFMKTHNTHSKTHTQMQNTQHTFLKHTHTLL